MRARFEQYHPAVNVYEIMAALADEVRQFDRAEAHVAALVAAAEERERERERVTAALTALSPDRSTYSAQYVSGYQDACRAVVGHYIDPPTRSAP
jgi:hypothetical protein